MTDPAIVRAELLTRHGAPVRVRPDDVPGQVLVFAHTTREAAEAYAEANREHYGHPTRVELRESVGWVSVVDLRPAIARLQAEHGGGSAA